MRRRAKLKIILIKTLMRRTLESKMLPSASEQMHSVATFKDILLWTPRGQTLPHKRILTFTNISELVECVLLPYKDDVAKPRALKTFYVIKAGGSISV